MTEIINLKQRRKAKERVTKEKQAEANRHKFGRTKEETLRQRQETERAARQLEGHKRETGEEE